MRGVSFLITGSRRGIAIGAALSLCCAMAEPVQAAQTAAGTTIVNTAALTHDADGAAHTIPSNRVALRVDAMIDVAILVAAETVIADRTATVTPVAFVVTNQGNAVETFDLVSSAGSRLSVAVDADRDGRYDPARDGADSVTIGPGESCTVFALVPGPVADATRVEMTATATTGHGAPGTVFTGAGIDGVDAVVGATGATATAATILVTPGDLDPSLTKSQSVVSPGGSPRAMPGSIVTYRLDARFPAATRGAAVSDDVPAGTSFVPGSITLDGQPLTDAADADAASFDGTTVHVTLGDVAVAGTRTISFQTRIK